MTRRIARGAAVALAALALAGPVRGDRIERRGREPELTGTVTAVDDSGVRLRSDLGAEHVVAWDRVLRVDVDPPHPAVERYRQTAVELWRARSRVERGDYALAEPLLERLFETYRGRTHETALVVAEGLLRCRIARGANAAAVFPALEVARLRRAGVQSDRYADAPAIIDGETLLCTSLPPVWMPDRALARLERELATYDAQGDAIVAALAATYRRAAAHQLGAPVAPSALDGAAAEAPGVLLLADLAACFAPGAEERAPALASVRGRLDALAPWARAWAHAAIGAALVAEPAPELRQLGIVHLLHVPVLWGQTQQHLAIVALQRAAAASRAAGDEETARTLLAELDRLVPGAAAIAAADRPPASADGSSP